MDGITVGKSRPRQVPLFVRVAVASHFVAWLHGRFQADRTEVL